MADRSAASSVKDLRAALPVKSELSANVAMIIGGGRLVVLRVRVRGLDPMHVAAD